MSTFAVSYTYSDDTATRDEVRPAHREFLRALNADGVVRASGPLDGGDSALLVVEAGSVDAVREILSADPFRTHGLVAACTIQEWNLVIGGLAA